ncbi:hypothetical protein [Marinilabilia salmonicolor]|uniref:hypothetical protein n=1 Tax=Marinilabilia salmonicolor TaxID=989 RepID=UPI0011E04F32|nr:hypothetical protein [Marinilabilia salmonicolor]
MTCLLVLVAGVTASILSSVDITPAIDYMANNSREVISMAAIPAGVITSSITPEIIQDLKVKYKHVKLVTVVVEPEEKDKDGKVISEAEQYQFVVRRPDRSHIKMLLPLAKDRKIDEFADKAIKNLVVGGDIDALEDGIVYMGVVSKLEKMIAPAATFLANA